MTKQKRLIVKKLNFLQNSVFGKINLTPPQPIRCTRAAIWELTMFYCLKMLRQFIYSLKLSNESQSNRFLIVLNTATFLFNFLSRMGS